MGKQCICQICSCGKHRCPHNATGPSRVINKAALDNCKVSEYGDGFKQRQPAKRGPFPRQKDLLETKGEVDYTTNNSDDFVPYDLQPRQIKEAEKYAPPEGKMNILSEYHSHYLGEKAVPAKIPPYLRSVTQAIPSGKMEQETSNKTDFKSHSAKPRTLPITKDKDYSPPKSPFTSTSIHRSDFLRFNDPPRPSARQPDKIDIQGPIIFDTSYKEEFKRHSISNKDVVSKKNNEYRPPSKPFAGNSLMHSDYVLPLSPRKADIFKPVTSVFRTTQRMEGHTTNLEDFKSWPVKANPPKSKQEYKKPEGEINLQSTSSDYRYFGKEAVPSKSARPKTKLRTGRDGMFCGISNYSTEFKFWGSTPALPIKMKDELTRISADTTDYNKTSEHKESYKRHNTAPARIFKPRTSVFKTNDAMHKKTVYNSEFSGRVLPQCPSERLLRDSVAGVLFEDDWDTGHRYVIGAAGGSPLKNPLPSIVDDKANKHPPIDIINMNQTTNAIGEISVN